jgi:hypothetical protein
MTKFRKIWNDPVGSKVIANLIWILIALSATGIYLIFTKITNGISLGEAWDSFSDILSSETSITGGQIVLTILIIGFIVINKKPFRSLILGFLKLIYNPDRYHINKEYTLTTNAVGFSQLTSVNTERSMNSYKIKPLDNSLHWKLGIYYSYNYKNLKENNLKECPYTLIYKNRDEALLFIEEYDKNQKLNPNSKKVILSDYYDQEFILNFNYEYNAGGIKLNIKRINDLLYESDVHFGYSDFLIKIWADKFDYKIKVIYDHYF